MIPFIDYRNAVEAAHDLHLTNYIDFGMAFSFVEVQNILLRKRMQSKRVDVLNAPKLEPKEDGL